MTRTASPRGAATRARILEIATTMLAEEGLEHFVLREIAKRAQLRLGNLQYYFPTRDDLLEAVIRAEFEHNLATMRALRDKRSSLAHYMRGLAQMMIEEYTGIGGRIWPVLTVMHLHSRRFRQLSRLVYQQHFETIVTAMRSFGVAGTDAALLERARLITALIDGAALQAHAGPHDRASRSWRSLCRRTGEMAAAIAAGNGPALQPTA